MDPVDEVKDYMKSRFTNPILGTLIVVWIFRNFNFIYALFNFDEKVTLTQRVNYISSYFSAHCTWEEVLKNIGIALFVMIITYLVLLISKSISNLYKRFIDLINSVSDKAAIVSTEKYLRVKGERDQFSKKKDEIEESLSNRNKDFNQLTEEHNHLRIEFDEYKKGAIHKVDEYSSDTNKLRKEVEELKSELAEALLNAKVNVDKNENLFQFLEKRYQSVVNDMDVFIRDAGINYLKTPRFNKLSDVEKINIINLKDLDNGRHLTRLITFLKDVSVFIPNKHIPTKNYIPLIHEKFVLSDEALAELNFPGSINDFISYIMANTPSK
ncbi:hypothetical protein D3C87_263300 [compost metagenome]